MTNFSRLDYVENQIRFLPVEVNWTEVKAGDVTAYTFYDENKNCHVVVTPKVQCLFMHECGHIIFGHNNYSELAVKLAEELFKKKFSNIMRSMEYDKIDVTEASIQYILNVAMDMEVNSRLFTLEEQEQVGKTVSETFKRISRPILPKDFGYPERMNYIYYLKKMSQDNEILAKLAEQQTSKSKYAELAKQQIQEIRDGKKDSFPQKSNRPDIKPMAVNQAIRHVISKIAKEHKMPDGTSVLNVTAKPQENEVNNNLDDYLDCAPDYSKITGKKFSSLEEALSCLIPKFVKTSRNDLLYNYNRRKHGNSGILIGKRIENSTPRIPSVYILMDCSLSMDENILNNIAETLKGVKLNSKSKVVFWDTENCGEVPYKNLRKLDEFPHGGGTELASGIRYINSFKKKEDALVIISDFRDNLENIRTALFEVNNKNHLMIAYGRVNPKLKDFKEFNTYITSDENSQL